MEREMDRGVVVCQAERRENQRHIQIIFRFINNCAYMSLRNTLRNLTILRPLHWTRKNNVAEHRSEKGH
jgi:hypothetical protein